MSKPKYSAFDLSHEKKLSCSMAQLIPIFSEEILPGDQFKIQTEVMLRFSPLIAPVMHRVNVFVHYFFVPNRLVWDSWEEFITGGQDGESVPSIPTVTANTAQMSTGSLADFLGVGLGTANSGGQEVNALMFRAYQLIWNEYFRDETLQDPVDFTLEAVAVLLRNRCWEKDYFTSSLPWTQRGPEVDVPITFSPETGVPDKVWDVLTGPPPVLTNVADVIEVNSSGNLFGANTGSGSALASVDNTNSLQLLINDLRESSRLQEWLEKNARGGYRYVEQLLSHFGVKSSDARLNRPEYLGGGRQPVVISEVLNSSATATEAQGTMAGHGISVGVANKANKRFEEHGHMFGIMSVLPRTGYQNGIRKTFLRSDKLDYYFPEFAHLGEQEVVNKEIWYDPGGGATNNAVFGYQQRFAEYKYGCSTVHGDFKSSLDFWHLGRKFASLPVLNSTFVSADPDTRIFAVETGDTLWCQVFNSVKARRPMPYFANPRL